MIKEVIDSWALFCDAYLSGWLIAIALSIIGVIVVARDQIFIGAAVAQASTLGIAAAMFIGMEDNAASLMAVAFAVFASLLTSRRSAGPAQHHEAITGWVFLIASSASVLLVAKSPHGLEEVHRLVASSIIGADRSDVWFFFALALATAAAMWFVHRPLLLITMDPVTAAAIGLRVSLWGYAIAIWLGLSLGSAMRSSGMLYTFGCLILPSLVARPLCTQVRQMFFVAPAVALACAITAFVVANHYDLPPAQATVALLSVAIIPSLMWRTLRR